MIIQHNMAAANTNRQLGITNTNLSKSTEKLSSGYRINRAGDDAAGLSISEKMRGQIRGLDQASTNAQDGISLIQTAEGAMNEIHSIVQRMRELTVQAANDTNVDEDRKAIQDEITQLTEEITRIADSTEFNTMKLINGDFDATPVDAGGSQGDEPVYDANGTATGRELTLQVGANNSGGAKTDFQGNTVDADGDGNPDNLEEQIIKFSIGSMQLDRIGNIDPNDLITASDSASTQANGYGQVIHTGDTKTLSNLAKIYTAENELDATGTAVSGGALVATAEEIATNLDILDEALKYVSEQRSNLGSIQNRLEHTIANADNTSENLQAAESRIRDVDMAEEMVGYSKDSILQQAAQSMLAQANQSTQGVLALLQ